MTQPSGGYSQSTGVDETPGAVESAKQAGGHVAETAADQAREVAQETKQQARDLMHEGRHQLREQARTGQQRAADGLGTIADELREMAGNTTQSGMATEVVRQASERLHEASAWLSKREPGDLIDEVRGWARQRPGTFLLVAAVAGVVAGRLTGGAVASMRNTQDTTRVTPPPESAYEDSYQVDPYRTPATPASVSTGTYEPGYESGTAYPAAGTGYQTGTGYQSGGQTGTGAYEEPYRQPGGSP